MADGISAVQQALTLLPICCSWTFACPARRGWKPPPKSPMPGEEQALPAIVFVTAYDQYALAAF